MELKKYFFELAPDDRQVFAESVGTTAKHLTNVSYGYKTLDEKVCVAIEQRTGRIVTRQELRPADWHLIWPELAEKAAV
jgi:DNA-binding transcriptional regulator YdaS (Cro superfamily)